MCTRCFHSTLYHSHFFFSFGIIVGPTSSWSKHLSLLFILLVTLMCTTTVSGSVTTNPKIVQRINYGTIFRLESKLILSKEVWLHTFHIWLPTYGTIEDIPRCTRISSYCSMMNHTVNYIHSIHIDTMVHVNHTVRSIPKLNSDRVQRGLLLFVGNLFSGLFGMATLHDVNILASHISI